MIRPYFQCASVGFSSVVIGLRGMKYQVILFDADGVTLKESQYFSDIYSEKYHVPIEKIRPFFSGVFQDCMVGKADLKEELSKVLPDWDWSGSVEEFLDLWFSSEDVGVNQNVIDLVQSLQDSGVKCYMTTNQEKYRGAHIRQQLDDVFDGFFISAEIGHKKEDLGFYAKVFEKVRSLVKDKSNILFIDDDKENVSTAKEFGFDVVHYKNFADLDELKS